jgi:DNA-nicking Smr family endonuclease
MPRSGRSLTSEEADLWQRVAGSTKPVAAKSRILPDKAPDAPGAVPRRAAPDRARPPADAEPAPAAVKSKAARKPPPIAQFDPRKVRHIAKGRIDIDARLDLHRSRQRDAREQLRGFLLSCHARGLRTVLVITGKGSDAPVDNLAHAMGERPRGIIRRSVPQWLDEPDLRAVVISYTAASVRHGGEGALYVQLRKPGRVSSE